LGFSISIPSNWGIYADRLEEKVTLEEVYNLFQQKFPDFAKTFEEFKQKVGLPEEFPSAKEAYQELLEELRASAREVYKRLMENPETFLISFEEFEQRYAEEQERRREYERRREELSQMEEGYFQALPPDLEGYPSVEVTKLKLTRPMTPLELYQLDRPDPDVVRWGNRPSRGITVDGLQGIKYYCTFYTGDPRKIPKFLNIYLAEEKVGWIISCSCLVKAFPKYKGIFTKIISSFHRI